MSCSFTGANAKLCIKREVTWGVLASGNWVQVPFISADFAAKDDTSEDPVLGNGRDRQRPTRDGVTVRGSITVPLDIIASGHWLTLLLGLATDSGSSDPYTHLFQSGAAALPSYSLEFQHGDAATPVYLTYNGVLADGATIRLGPTGRPQLQINLIAIDEEEDGTSDAGTPNVVGLNWLSMKQSVLTKGGSPLAKVTDLTVNIANNWDAVRTIGSGGLIACADPGLFSADGTITLRTNDSVMAGIATAGTVFALAFGWSVSASRSLLFGLDQAELTRNGRAIRGPGAIERTFNIMASKDVTAADSLRATLTNQQVAY